MGRKRRLQTSGAKWLPVVATRVGVVAKAGTRGVVRIVRTVPGMPQHSLHRRRRLRTASLPVSAGDSVRAVAAASAMLPVSTGAAGAATRPGSTLLLIPVLPASGRSSHGLPPQCYPNFQSERST